MPHPHPSQPPTGPTRHPPGSAAKVLVLVARALAGLPLFDAGDSAAPAGRPAPTQTGGSSRRVAGVSADNHRGRTRYRARLWMGWSADQPRRRLVLDLGLYDTQGQAEYATEAARRRLAAGDDPLLVRSDLRARPRQERG